MHCNLCNGSMITYTWTRSSVNTGDVWYVRAWLVYNLNGTEHTV